MNLRFVFCYKIKKKVELMRKLYFMFPLKICYFWNHIHIYTYCYDMDMS